MIVAIQTRRLHGTATTVAFSKAFSYFIQTSKDTLRHCQRNTTALLDLYEANSISKLQIQVATYVF